jgi:hypothetical protein
MYRGVLQNIESNNAENSKMARTHISHEEYDSHIDSCVEADGINPKHFYVARQALVGVSRTEGQFARERLVQVMWTAEHVAGVELELLPFEDDGSEAADDPELITLDTGGHIISDAHLDLGFIGGYLLGGMPPPEDGSRVTKESLLVPVAFMVAGEPVKRAIELPQEMWPPARFQ